jgi:hypothetical protein
LLLLGIVYNVHRRALLLLFVPVTPERSAFNSGFQQSKYY